MGPPPRNLAHLKGAQYVSQESVISKRLSNPQRPPAEYYFEPTAIASCS